MRSGRRFPDAIFEGINDRGIKRMRDMLGREQVTTAEAALHLLLENLSGKIPSEGQRTIEDALGYISSRDVLSPEDIPGFRRSTVDGYAVMSGDTFGASESVPGYLSLSGEILMGKKADCVVSKGTACSIPTGGMLPEHADAVVMYEHVQAVDSSMIEVLKPVAPGENVIQAGEDVIKGGIVLKKGRSIRPQHIAAAAAVGITDIWVYDKPRVSIISTGDEIVHPGTVPQPGQIRDTNSYLIAGMVSEGGGIPERKGIFKDEAAVIREVIEQSMTDSDVIVISGGTSVGTKDLIARILNDIGRPGVLFHGVSLKPGKPMIGGVVDGKPVFGLPGHPAAVSVCFDLFVGPVLRSLSGIKEGISEHRGRCVAARLSKNIASVQGREEHVRVMLEKRDDVLWAVPVLGKSGLISTLVQADGTIVIPMHINGIEKGDVVEVRLF